MSRVRDLESQVRRLALRVAALERLMALSDCACGHPAGGHMIEDDSPSCLYCGCRSLRAAAVKEQAS